jgi:glycerophosphoryl diester phosphodiesterase
VVAHRGASGELLENTIDACRRAVALGAPMLEVDVQLAADGELVVVHDWDLVRLAGDRRVVERLAAAELAAVALGLGDRRGHAPTLGALLAALPPDYPVNLELKRRQAPRPAFAAALRAATVGRGQLLVSSFDHDLLAEVAAALPGVPLSPLEAHDAAALLSAGERLGAWGLHCHRRLASASLAAAAAAGGRPLLAYTVDDPEEARRLFALGLSGVFTDWPGRLLAALGSKPPLVAP